MNKHTQGKWVNGYGGGLTGPTTPSIVGPTVQEVVEWDEFREQNYEGKAPTCKHTVVSCGTRTIAIVPTYFPVQGEANACLIAAAPDLLEACKGDTIDEVLRELAKPPEDRNWSRMRDLLLFKQALMDAAIAKIEEIENV